MVDKKKILVILLYGFKIKRKPAAPSHNISVSFGGGIVANVQFSGSSGKFWKEAGAWTWKRPLAGIY